MEKGSSDQIVGNSSIEEFLFRSFSHDMFPDLYNLFQSHVKKECKTEDHDPWILPADVQWLTGKHCLFTEQMWENIFKLNAEHMVNTDALLVYAHLYNSKP